MERGHAGRGRKTDSAGKTETQTEVAPRFDDGDDDTGSNRGRVRGGRQRSDLSKAGVVADATGIACTISVAITIAISVAVIIADANSNSDSNSDSNPDADSDAKTNSNPNSDSNPDSITKTFAVAVLKGSATAGRTGDLCSVP